LLTYNQIKIWTQSSTQSKTKWIRHICFIIACGSYLCVVNATQPNNSPRTFESDIENMKEIILSPSHWKNKLSPEQSPILSSQQITQQNVTLFRNNQHMNDINAYPNVQSRSIIVDKIVKISKIPATNRYYTNSTQVSKDDFLSYQKSLNLQAVPESVGISYAMVVKRTNLRSFPTTDAVFKKPGDTNLDRFQETALFPAEAVALLHESYDKNWYFVVAYNYSGWVKKIDIAIANKKTIFKHKSTEPFLIITGDKVFTTFNPHRSQVSNIQLDMGTKLTLLEKNLIPTSLDGQNTYASHVIVLPTRSKDGHLEFEPALISRSKDVHIGYLPFTQQNIIDQSFKFLGERYGWGHSFNARDCTGFVGDVYKSFGILMPRNTGQQAASGQGQNIHFSKNASIDEKMAGINSLEVGDLIYIPGHVMMFLGMQNDKPFVIHDVSGLAYTKEDGSFYKSTLNGVSVTPLFPLQENQELSYLDLIYNLKKIK